MRTIRFCRTPLHPEHLNNQELAVYQKYMFVCAAMGTMLWSLEELLVQCQRHEELSNRAALSTALIELMQIGMVRTEESVFLEEEVQRIGRALDGTFTFEDVEWGASQLAIRVGGSSNRWVMNLIAYGLGELMRGVCNCVETVYSRPDTDEEFTVTVTRKNGKTPMDLRGELLRDLAALVRAGGGSVDQLQHLIDANTPSAPAVGVAVSPQKEPLSWVRYFGDHLRCFRCMARKNIEFPCDDVVPILKEFAANHERCLPTEQGTGAAILAVKEGPDPASTEVEEEGDGDG